jgi:hypothetical protein
VAADVARSHGHGVRILGPHRIVSRDVKYKISELVMAGSVPDKQLAEWNPSQNWLPSERRCWARKGRELCRKEMVIKPGLVENERKGFSAGSASENCGGC